MSKFGDFLDALKKNIAERKESCKQEKKPQETSEEAVKEEPAIEEEGVNNAAFTFRGKTINKKRVFFVAVLCIAAFFASFFFFSRDSARPPRPQNIEVSDRITNNGDNKYANLARKDQPQNVQPGQAGQSGNQTAKQPEQTMPTRQAALSSAAPPSNVSIVRQQVSAEETEAKKVAKIQADALTAAISFSLTANPASTGNNNVAARSTNTNTGAAVTASSRQSPVENSLYAGTLLPAILMNGASSDLGGQLMAQITADIFDSLQGDTLLIPMGSRLIGRYEPGAATGQSRVAVNWTLLILPDGSSYNLGELTSSDEAGYPGIPGNVNNHTDKVLKGGVMSTALAALGSVAAGNTGSSDDESAGKLAMQGATANLLNSASALFNKNLNIKPTITIAPGATFTVRVNQTLILQPYHS